MIEFSCPDCDKQLRADDAKSGKLCVCPGCKTRFRIPEAEPEEEPVEDAITEEPPRRSKSAIRRRSEEDEDEDDRRFQEEEDEEPRRPRKLKKKKKKRRQQSFELPLGLDTYTASLIGAVVFGLLFVPFGFLWAPLAYIPMVVAAMLAVFGGVWFLIVVVQDSVMQLVLCWLIPFYSLFYLITHFDECKRPFFAYLAALVLFAAGGCGVALVGHK